MGKDDEWGGGGARTLTGLWSTVDFILVNRQFELIYCNILYIWWWLAAVGWTRYSFFFVNKDFM